MPEDARFVAFLTRERGSLHGYSLVALGLALLAGASLLTVAWGRHEALLATGILSALIVTVTGVTRHYRREFGRVKPVASDHKEPWFIGIALGGVESFARHSGGGTHTGIITLILAATLAFHAFRGRTFRKHAFLLPALLLYIGVERLSVSADMELWLWLQRSIALCAIVLVGEGLADHLLLIRGFSPGNRQLAISSMPPPAGRGLPAEARDPIAATMITALNACQEADVTFLGGITGLGHVQASSWVDALRRAGLVWVHEEGRRGATRTFVRLSADGHDVARRLWD